jgi:hypothetical protein
MLCSKFLQHKQNHLKYAGLCLLEEVFKRSPPLLSSSQETCLRLCLGNKNHLKYAGLCLLEEVFKRSPSLLSSSQEACLRLCLGNKNHLKYRMPASASWRRYSRGLLHSSHPAKSHASGSV